MAMPNHHAAEYLKQVNQFNPMFQSAELVELRANQFQIVRQDQPKSSELTGDDLQQLRDSYKKFLNRIQAQFWQLPQPSLVQQLGTIDSSRLPELVPVLDRLKTVANCRSEFPKLAQEPWMIGPLFHAFKTAVVLPQAEAGVVRERFTSSIPHRRELAAIRYAVKNIEQYYPVLFALERNFFQTLLKLELPANRAASLQPPTQQTSTWPGLGWHAVWIGLMIINLLIALARQWSTQP